MLGAIEQTPGRDYRYRARVRAADLGEFLAQSVCAIDYDNFKERVATVDNMPGRMFVYHRVWAALKDWQDALVGEMRGVVPSLLDDPEDEPWQGPKERVATRGRAERISPLG